MLWQHIEWHTDKDQRYLRIWVSGKTGGRWLIAKHRAASALVRLDSARISHQVRKILFRLRHTYATIELMS